MRTTRAVLVSILIVPGVILASGQDSARSKIPAKGETIVVKGCLRGTLLESAETAGLDEPTRLSTAYNYQLKGRKDLLKRLRAQHDGQIVELTGVLQSTLDQGTERGTRIGRARIVVGVDPTPRRTAGAPDLPLPVLDVKSYTGAGTVCRS